MNTLLSLYLCVSVRAIPRSKIVNICKFGIFKLPAKEVPSAIDCMSGSPAEQWRTIAWESTVSLFMGLRILSIRITFVLKTQISSQLESQQMEPRNVRG